MTALLILSALAVFGWALIQFMAWAVFVAWVKGPLTLAFYGLLVLLALRLARALRGAFSDAWDWLAGSYELWSWKRRLAAERRLFGKNNV